MKSLKNIFKREIFLNSLPLSFSIIKNNILRLSFPLLSDLLLIFLYGFMITGFIAEIITNEMIKYGIEVSKAQGNFLNEAGKPILVKILLLILAMILITYILFVIFQSISWWYCRRISKLKEKGFFDYFREFCKINIFWFIVIVVYNIISYLNGLLSRSESPSIILNVIFLALLYLALISYSLLPEIKGFANIRKTFSYGIKKISTIMPAYLIALLVFFVINIILTLSLKIGNLLFILLGVFLLIPTISWMRIYFMVVVGKLSKFNK